MKRFLPSLIALALFSVSAPSFAEDLTISAVSPSSATIAFTPFSSDRYFQLDQTNRSYETQRNYGLTDHSDEELFLRGYNDQKTSYFNEMLSHESSTQGNTVRNQVQANVGDTTATRSLAFVGTAYIYVNGRPVKRQLSDDTEVSFRARAVDRSGTVAMSTKNVSPLKLVSALNYHFDPVQQWMNASLSREIFPHVSAAVEQQRTAIVGNAPVNESRGTVRYGISF